MEDPKTQSGVILELIRRFPNGLSIGEILKKMDGRWTRRTLQRRLHTLKKEGLIRAEGERRSVSYFATRFPKEQQESSEEIERFDFSLSKQGEEVRSYVTSPLSHRKPIGYQREFLKRYVPNKDFYLSPVERQKLHEIGKQPDGEKPAGTFAREIFDRLLIDLSWNSSRLEGNTYSLLETERLITQGLEAQGKSFLETQMILNHKQAIDFLVTSADAIQMDSITIRNLHALLSDELLGNTEACGRLRSIPVGISGTVFHPLEIPQLIEECFKKILMKADVIKDPFEQAFFLMVHLPYLQPFEDVNKRVARLTANIPLIKKNLCPLSFVDVQDERYVEGILGVYELNRVDLLKDVFLWAYKRSTLRYSAIRHSMGSPDPFRMQYRDAIKKLVRQVVIDQKSKQNAVKFIHEWSAEYVKKGDYTRFIEVVETELMALHIGNIQRYKVSPDQFESWQEVWSHTN